jgi:uncharacterized protein YjbI with pentapeptide repeats
MELKDETLVGADLRGSSAFGARFTRCRFEQVQLSSSDLRGVTIEDCTFIGCDFDHASLAGPIRRSTFRNCSFDFAAILACPIEDSSFQGRAQFSDWTDSSFARCRLHLDLYRARFDPLFTDGVDYTGCNFQSTLIRHNCAFISGNTFDKRMIELILSLWTTAKGPADTLEGLKRLISPRMVRVFQKLWNMETGVK